MLRPARKGTNLNPLGITTLIISALIIIGFQAPSLLNANTDEGFNCSIIGAPLLLGLIIVGPAYVLGRISKSDKTYNISILVIALLIWGFIGSTIYSRVSEKSNNKLIYKQLSQNSIHNDTADYLNATLEGNADDKLFEQKIKNQHKKTKELVNNLEGRDKVILQKVLAVAEQKQKMQDEINLLVDQMDLSRTVNFTVFTNKEDLLEYKYKIEKWHKLNNKILVFLNNLDSILRNSLNSVRINEEEIKFLTEKFKNGMAYDQSVTIQQCEVDFSQAMLDTCTMLENEWGNWYYSDTSQQMLFESDANALKYNQYLDTIQELATREQEVQREMAEFLTQLKQ